MTIRKSQKGVDNTKRELRELNMPDQQQNIAPENITAKKSQDEWSVIVLEAKTIQGLLAMLRKY